ncbi:apolipoprotein N-acyltransferase [Sandaracinobacteroides saxicola]|uniref:Apolipoprotein N-acyltransferase n=1 Tax=Sandaracinobacteroides saxicola TaxID=2759707 RepID=A0A7G5IHM8_9SPHN|nr:apolipoprotein N-acyltransferase [Sandaracinobacteroides saxicola]QMW22870.1 apolipoprotein N-acyltransferase [Sandaracinobacteroides saxicola]
MTPPAARLAALPPPARLLLAALAGLIAATGFAPLENIAPVLLGGTLLLLLLNGATTARAGFALGWAFGLAHFALGFDWIATAFGFQAAMPVWMGWVAVVGLSAFLAVYPGLAAALTVRFARTAVTRALLFAAAWMAGEWLRGTLFTGFAWNPLGAPWLQLPGVAALAAVIGAIGLSGLALLCAGSFAALIGGRGERGRAALVAVFPLVLALGLLWPRIRPAPPPPLPGVQLFLVQANIDQAQKLAPNSDATILTRYLALTQSITPGSGTPVIIWPEAAIEMLLEEEPALRAVIGSALPPRGMLLTGGVAVLRDGSGAATAATNSLFALDPKGRIRARYDKAHLVPGGEYLPLRWLAEPLGLARLVPGSLDFRPGPGPRTLRLPGIPPFGVQICYEIIFPARVVAADRPAWLLTVSNDAWFGASGPPQHFAQARLRAIEEGLPVVRVTPTGISGVIDARGQVLARVGMAQAAVLPASVPGAAPATPFARWGHGLTLVFGLLLLGATLALQRERKI